tara:strand:- start:291 stop:7943 length:7653 start_codon:yes stop_codon:yes gene_type:complete
MANPFKDIFKRKYTPYYSVEGVDDATKQQIREFGQQLQQDPTRFTEQQAENITTLNYRLDNPIDPDLELYESIQEGTPGRGAFGQRQTLEDKKLKVTQMAMGKNKERTEDLIAGIQGISEPEPVNTLTNVESVIQESQVDENIEDELQQARQRIIETKRDIYTRALGVDPYKNVVTAFDNWWKKTKQNEEEFEKYVQKYQTTTDLKNDFKKSLQKGTLEKDFGVEIPEEQKLPEQKLEIPTTEALPESTEQDISVQEDFDKVPEASQDMYARGISGVMLKYENVNNSTDLGKNLIKLNNLWAIKYGPRAAKFGAKDSGIPASDGGTWAQWDNEEEMQKGSRAVINEMYFIDAEGNPQRFVLNYILGPNATQEQIIANKDAINNRVKEINNSMAAMDQFEAARQEIESRKDKTEIAQLYTAEDAVKDIWLNPTKYIPMGDLLPYQAQKINYILDIAEKFDTDPSTLSMKELTDFKEYISDKNFKATATWSAQLTEMILQMPAFFGETYGAGKILKYGGKFTKSLKGLTPAKAAERINKILPDNALDKLNLAIKNKKSLQVSSGIAKNVTQAAVGTYISGDVNTATLENFMPGYQFNEDGQVMKIYNGMDKLSAERQAFWSTFIEFGSELTGPAGRKFWDMLKKSQLGEAAANTFIKGYKKLGMPEKEAVMNTAVYKAFQKLNPGVSDDDVNRVFQEFGYHGILEEVFEERVGDASRAFLKKLTDLGIVEGFDNPDWDLKMPTWDQISMELVAFAVPGGVKGTVSAGKKIAETRRIKKASPEFASQYKEAARKDKEEKQELSAIQKKDTLTEEDVKRADEINQNKITFDALTQFKDIIVTNKEIAKEVDLSGVDFTKEAQVTAKELQDLGVSMEGEGLASDTEKSNILGYTMFTNQKLKLGLNKGATYDTVLEEYYGLMRRGGLTQEQKNTYDQHYEKYETDADYRQGVNEFINRMHDKMGLPTAVADVNQTLSSDKLFDKEGKSYEYKAAQEPKKDVADKVFDYVGNLFNKALGRYEIKDEVKDIYKKVQKRKLKVSTAKAIELDKKEEEPKAKPKKAVKKKPTDEIREVTSLTKEGKRAVEIKIANTYEKGVKPLQALKNAVSEEQFTELTGLQTKEFNKVIKNKKKSEQILKKIQKKTGKKTIDLLSGKGFVPRKKKPDVSYQLSPASLSNQKYGAIKGFVKELAKEGEPARFWYEQSGKALLDITGGNKEEAKKLLSIIAITSPQMDVLTNFGQMVKGYYKAIKGEEPLAGRFPSAMSERIKKVMAGEEFGGLKTDKFYKNLMTVVEGGTPDVTVDMWMMRAFGIDKDSPTDLEYRRIEKHVQDIADDLGWEPYQVQAAIWVSTKARWESIYSQELKNEKNLGRYKGSGKWSSEKVYKNFRKKMFTKLKKVDLKDRSLIKAGFNYKDAINKYKGRISLEVIPHPSTNVLPGIHTATYKEKLEYHKAIIDVLSDENGQDIIAKTLKMPTITKHNTPGFYEGESNPSHHTEVLFSEQKKYLKAGQLDKVINKETINNVELYAAVEGLVTKQQAVGYTKEFEAPSKKLANSVAVEAKFSISDTEMRKIYDGMLELGIDTGPMPTDYGFVMVNFMDNDAKPFSGVDNNQFYENVKNVLDKVFPDSNFTLSRYTTLGGLLENNWKENEDGKVYRERINQSNRQDSIRELVDTLNGEIAEVNKIFEKKYGWNKPSKKPQVSYQLAPAEQSLSLDAETTIQEKTRKYINSLKRIKQVVEEIGEVDEMTNPYLQAKIYPGRVSSRLEDFNKYIEGFVQRLDRAKISIPDFGDYLYARHAEERNDAIKERDPEFEGSGSGMTAEEAERILEKLDTAKIRKFAKEFDKNVIGERLNILKDGGLISEETYELFTKDSPYENYVPLKGGENKQNFKAPQGGFNIVGKDIYRAGGRNSKADNPFIAAISDYADAQIRSEQNKVAQRLYLLAIENPADYWKARGKKYRPQYNKEGELLYLDPQKLQTNEIQVLIDGKYKIVEINDKPLLETFRKLGSEKTYKSMQAFNQYLRSVYTTYNPDFIVGNFVRDLQTALVNIKALAPDKNISKKILRDVFGGAPMRAIYRQVRDKDIKTQRFSLNRKKLDVYAKYYDEMRAAGGTVGWFTNRKTTELLKQLEKSIKRQKNNPMNMLRSIGKFANDFNIAIEQATRLAAYKNLRESGYTEKQAALATRDLTVDFNQKGQEGELFRASYLFSNAGIQGSYILLNSLFGKNGKKARRLTYALTMQSFILGLVNALLMDDPDADDPEDRYPWTDGIPDYEKDSYLMYPLPNGQMFKLQVGWGLNVFHAIGNGMAEIVVAKYRNKEPKYANSALRIANSIGSAFSPIGFGFNGISSFMPTAFGTKPLWEIVDNAKFTGAPIAKIRQQRKPRSQETFTGVNPYTKMATDWISQATGGGLREGGLYKGGLIEINPEYVDHIIETLGGGNLSFIRNSYRTGYDLLKYGEIKRIKSVPIIRKFITEPGIQQVNTDFYDMHNISTYTRFSDSKLEDFERYYDILLNENERLYEEAETDKQKDILDTRLRGYERAYKILYNNQDKLK